MNTRLEDLNLSYNKITDLLELQVFLKFPQLKKVNIQDNPICEQKELIDVIKCVLSTANLNTFKAHNDVNAFSQVKQLQAQFILTSFDAPSVQALKHVCKELNIKYAPLKSIMTVLTEEESSSAKDGSQVQSISASLGSAISLTSNENETVSIEEEEEDE